MRYSTLLTLLICALLYSACGDEIPAVGTIDSKITEQEAKAQNYNNLMTPGFGIQVAIRDDVSGDTSDLLDLLDDRAAEFLECQFMSFEIGSQPFQIKNGETVSPLSELRAFVVPFNFECDAVDTDVCAGIFFPDSDLIIISKESLGRCGEFPLWKHELGHRYGMALDHRNQGEFEPCIDPPGCLFDELPGG